MFKTASRTLDELTTAKADLDKVFDIVKGSSGRVNRTAFKELEQNKFEIAELIIQLLSDTVTITDPTAFLVDTIEGDIRNTYVWQEMNSALRVVNRSYGSKPLSQRLTFKEYGITTTHREIAVEIPLEEVAVGRVTASQVVDRMADAINRHRIHTILTALDAAIPSGADQTGRPGFTLRYATLTAPNLDNAIDGLLEITEGVSMFARHASIASTIRGFAGWSDVTKAEFERRGMIGSYHGAPIVTLKDTAYKTGAAELTIPSNRMWLAGAKKGAVWQTKDVSFLNWTELNQKNAVFGVGTRLEDGLLVHDPYLYRMIEV